MMRLSLLLAALSVAAAASANSHAVAPVDMINAASFMKDVLASQQHSQQHRRADDSNAAICNGMGGTMIDDAECQLCPGGDEDAGCCAIDLESFDFSCDVCETIDGTQECARVQCGLTDEGGYGCNGCGDYSSGQACFDFECSGGVEADCKCNSITWNGQDCGECSIDSNDNPIFDCSAVGGPGSDTSSSNVVDVGASAAMLAIAALGVLVNAM